MSLTLFLLGSSLSLSLSSFLLSGNIFTPLHVRAVTMSTLRIFESTQIPSSAMHAHAILQSSYRWRQRHIHQSIVYLRCNLFFFFLFSFSLSFYSTDMHPLSHTSQRKRVQVLESLFCTSQVYKVEFVQTNKQAKCVSVFSLSPCALFTHSLSLSLSLSRMRY